MWPREEFVIALNLTFTFASVMTSGFKFGGGICLGYAIFQILHLKEFRRRRHDFKNTQRTIHVVEQLIGLKGLDSYKLIHQLEKADRN